MANVGEISASMTLDASQFGSGLARASADVRTFAGDVDEAAARTKALFRGAGSSGGGSIFWKALTAIGAAQTARFLVDVSQEAAHAEEAVNGFAVTFGGRASDVERFARGMADQFHISINDILDAESKVGSIFQGAGLGESQVAEFSKNIGALAVDYARFKNTTVQASFDKLLSGLAGESEPLRAFGIFLNEASVKAKALQLGLGGLHGELTEGEKIQARYALIMDKGQVAMGAAAREAGGAAAQFEALSGEWSNLRVALGEVVAPHVATVFSDLTAVLAGVRKEVELLQGKGGVDARDLLPDWGGALAADVPEMSMDRLMSGIRELQELERKTLAEEFAKKSLPSFRDALNGSPLFDAAQWADLESIRVKKPTSLFAGAALRGSSDAASTIFRSRFGGGEKTAEKTEANTRTTAANTERLVDGISVMTGKLEALKTSPSPDWQ